MQKHCREGGVFGASREQLLATPGVTPRLAEWIGLTGELMRAYYDLHAETDIRLSCYQEVQAFVAPRAAEADGPGLWAIYADFDFNLITYTDFGAPEDDRDAAVARRIMIEAIHTGASYVYLVRLTGDGMPEPDAAALARLEALSATLRAADIDLVDCVLAGRGEVRSLRVMGRFKVEEHDARRLALHEAYVGDPR